MQAVEKLLPLTERKLIHHAGDVHEFRIIAARAFLRGKIANVLRVRSGEVGIVLQGLFGVAYRTPPSERIQEIQALREAMLQAGRKPVVVVVARWIYPSDRTETLVRAPRLN